MINITTLILSSALFINGEPELPIDTSLVGVNTSEVLNRTIENNILNFSLNSNNIRCECKPVVEIWELSQTLFKLIARVSTTTTVSGSGSWVGVWVDDTSGSGSCDSECQPHSTSRCLIQFRLTSGSYANSGWTAIDPISDLENSPIVWNYLPCGEVVFHRDLSFQNDETGEIVTWSVYSGCFTCEEVNNN